MTDNLLRDRILAAAHGLMSGFGVRSVTMDDLASHMGISKKTIYKVFRDKDAIVEALVEVVLQRNSANCQEDLKKSENAVHEMVLAMDRVVEMLEPMSPMVLHDLRKYHPAAFLSIHRHKREFLFGIMKSNLLRGVREGLYRPEIRPDIMARFRVESMMLPFDPDFSGGHRFSLAEMEFEILRHYLFGLVNNKGYKLFVKYLNKRSAN